MRITNVDTICNLSSGKLIEKLINIQFKYYQKKLLIFDNLDESAIILIAIQN